jgi:drug/metabolite transporter superfamily protein YnfA
MNGLPHYFLIGLVITYVYWLLINNQVTEMTDGFIEIVGAYLGWLSSEKAQSKQMALVMLTLICSLLLIMVLNPTNLPSMVGLLVFISVGWLGSLSTNKGSF